MPTVWGNMRESSAEKAFLRFLPELGLSWKSRFRSFHDFLLPEHPAYQFRLHSLAGPRLRTRVIDENHDHISLP